MVVGRHGHLGIPVPRAVVRGNSTECGCVVAPDPSTAGCRVLARRLRRGLATIRNALPVSTHMQGTKIPRMQCYDSIWESPSGNIKWSDAKYERSYVTVAGSILQLSKRNQDTNSKFDDVGMTQCNFSQRRKIPRSEKNPITFLAFHACVTRQGEKIRHV